MMKKLLLSGSLLVVLAGSGWYYSAQRFEKEAKIVLENVEKLSPWITYKEAKIDKYRFDLTFKGLEFDYKPESSEAKSDLKPVHITLSEELRLSYNPMGKTLTIKGEKAAEHILKFGDVVVKIKSEFGETPTRKITFNTHPVFEKATLFEILSSIKCVESFNDKFKILNADNNEILISAEAATVKYEAEHKGNNVEIEGELKTKDLMLSTELATLIKNTVKSLTSDPKILAQLNELDFTFNGIPGSADAELKFTVDKKEVEAFMASHVPATKTYDWTLLPTAEAKVKQKSTSSLMDGDFLLDLSYNQASKKLKAAYEFSMTGHEGANDYYQKLIHHMINTGLNSEGNSSVAISLEEAKNFTPDFAALSPMKFSFNVEAQMNPLPEVADLSLIISTKDSALKLKGAGNLMAANATLTLENYKQLISDLQNFSTRVVTADTAANKEWEKHGMSKEALQAMITGYVSMVNGFIDSLGKVVQEGSSANVEFEVVHNTASGETKVNGKPIAEIMGGLVAAPPAAAAAPTSQPPATVEPPVAPAQ